MTEKNYDRELLKQKFIEVRGYWDESLGTVKNFV